MSTQTIATAPVGGFADARQARAANAAKGFFARLFDAMIASRQAEANRLINQYLATLSAKERKALGYPASGEFTGR